MKVDEISQSERRKVLANDRKVLSSYLDHAQASADDDRGGRFAVRTPTTIVGMSAIQYPRQPADSPANQAAMTGPEPPLGFSVNDQEPVGEIHERGNAAAPEVPNAVGLRRRGWRRL